MFLFSILVIHSRFTPTPSHPPRRRPLVNNQRESHKEQRRNRWEIQRERTALSVYITILLVMLQIQLQFHFCTFNSATYMLSFKAVPFNLVFMLFYYAFIPARFLQPTFSQGLLLQPFLNWGMRSVMNSNFFKQVIFLSLFSRIGSQLNVYYAAIKSGTPVLSRLAPFITRLDLIKLDKWNLYGGGDSGAK